MGRRIHGYYDMGSQQIPRTPPLIALTGRDDGLYYRIVVGEVDGERPTGSRSVGVSTITDTTDHRVYGAYEGPYIEGPFGATKRLYVSGATLRIEDGPTPAQALTRVFAVRTSNPLEVWEVTYHCFDSL